MPEINAERVLSDLRAEGARCLQDGCSSPDAVAEHVACSWLEGELEAIGHEAKIDGIANVFGLSRGRGPKLLGGSHLESQNHAGWLDGPLGVVYALEAARVIAADAAFAGCGVDVIACCDEEGHFGSFLGSRSAVGDVDQATLDAAVDRTTGRRLDDALAAVGLAGVPRYRIDPQRYVGFLEAHIEQGDWLVAHDLSIGIVTRIVGIRQYRVTFEGFQNHAGTTRMEIRRDAAFRWYPQPRSATFPAIAGRADGVDDGTHALDPGAPSVIPGRAEMTFQMRDPDNEVLDRLEAALTKLVETADARPCRVRVERTQHTSRRRWRRRSWRARGGGARVPAATWRCRAAPGTTCCSRTTASRHGVRASIGGISHH